MTPDPNTPRFIIHEVPESACDNSKKLSQYYFLLRELINGNRWNGINEKDISLNYNTYDGCTEVEIIFRDKNNHYHHFTMQLVPDNGFGDTDEDSFRLVYLFEATFDENALRVRSFAEYIAPYLQYEGFQPTLMNCDKGLYIPCSVEYAYDGICQLLDIIIPQTKPLSWFYTKEPSINSFSEAYYYLSGVCSQLKLQSCKGRWDEVMPENFIIDKFENEEEAYIELTYTVRDVWDITLSVNVIQLDGYQDLFCSVNCYPNKELSDNIKTKLNTLFAEFLTSLKIAKGNTYVGCGLRDHSISIQYFNIEDTFDKFCYMLDEVIPALHSYTFHLPSQPTKLTGEIETIKEQMETALNTTLEIITEEDEINKKLRMDILNKLGLTKWSSQNNLPCLPSSIG